MADTVPDSDMAPNGGAAKARRARRFRIFGAVLAAAALIGGGVWLMTHNEEETDDAFVEADVVQVAPQVGGPVAALYFTDNQWVKKGQPLLDLDRRDTQAAFDAARAAVDVARAQLGAAQADLELTRATSGAALAGAGHALAQAREQQAEAGQQVLAAEAEAERAAADAKRYDALLKSTFASRQRYEQALADARASKARWKAAQAAAAAAQAQRAQARAKLTDAEAAPTRVALKAAQAAVAKAQVEQAEAALRQAALNLSYTHVLAPQAGRIAKRAVAVGDVVQKDQILTELVTEPQWVVANFKETQLTRMKPGQPVRITVDAFPGHVFKGRVDSIQPGSGARFALLPTENATGNYVKVVQRVPVKITFDDPSDPLLRRLVPGMSVEPVVDVGFDPTAK